MIRRLLVCLAMSVSPLIARLPDQLQANIVALHARGELTEIRQVSYKEGSSCAAVIGINAKGAKVAFVALRYIGNNSTFKWTPFKSVPFDQQNDTFGLISDGPKVVVIQSNSKIDHQNSVGFHVELDPVSHTVILRLVELGSFSRVPNEQWEDQMTF